MEVILYQLKTGLGEKQEKLSKEDRRAHLRQVWGRNKKSCQKKCQLETGLREKREKLSKEELT
jgi:hypothetical protein